MLTIALLIMFAPVLIALGQALLAGFVFLIIYIVALIAEVSK